jgi:dynein assembly factor 3
VEKELLARAMLELSILNETDLTMSERVELFLDIYGNCLIRQKSQHYLDYMVKELSRLITQDARCEVALKKILDLSLLKYKQRDELEEVVKSWYSKVPFDIEKYRDQRLRYHYKERYDYRLNMIDWDYHTDVSTFV